MFMLRACYINDLYRIVTGKLWGQRLCCDSNWCPSHCAKDEGSAAAVAVAVPPGDLQLRQWPH